MTASGEEAPAGVLRAGCGTVKVGGTRAQDARHAPQGERAGSDNAWVGGHPPTTRIFKKERVPAGVRRGTSHDPPNCSRTTAGTALRCLTNSPRRPHRLPQCPWPESWRWWPGWSGGGAPPAMGGKGHACTLLSLRVNNTWQGSRVLPSGWPGGGVPPAAMHCGKHCLKRSNRPW